MKDLDIENYLDLCYVCGGTGINPNDSKHDKCPKCDGNRILNHFSISFEINVPYRSEHRREENKQMILHHIGEIEKILGVVNIKEK